jgi:hypothetical protein
MARDIPDLTFFAWADTHFGYEQRFLGDDLRGDIIDQMNDLPGWPYPEGLGGVVAEPDFVLHGGDMVDGDAPRAQQELDYYRQFLSRLRFPHHEVYGNHDITEEFTQHFLKAHGGTSYSFDCKGVHFVSLAGVFDEQEVGSFEPEDLEFLQADLAAPAEGTPVVVATHSRLDRTKNGEDVATILRPYRVILLIGAHIHKPGVSEVYGITNIDLGHCRNHPIDPEYGRSFYIIRIASGRLVALPWRWDLRDWERGRRWADPDKTAQRFVLDKAF